MTTRTSQLQTLYEETAREFARRVRERFPREVHSIVLYGSVARGTATEDSDVDVLVLTSNARPARYELVEVSESLDFENNYHTFLITTAFAPERLEELVRGGFPIAEAILTEGVVLYDDGTFERIRKDAVGAG